MFSNLFEHVIKEEKEFDMSSLQRQFWTKLIKLEQDAIGIHFDLENDEPHGDPKEVELDIKHPSGEPVKVLCQLFAAGGDWESNVGYFRCQYQPMDFFFIYIPGPEVNKNLVKREEDYSPLGNDENNDGDPVSDFEKELWDDLKKGLNDRMREETDPDKWEPDYKKMRMFSGYPSKG